MSDITGKPTTRQTIFTIVFALMVLIFFICLLDASKKLDDQEQNLREQAIKLGYAHYDTNTGCWQWNTTNWPYLPDGRRVAEFSTAQQAIELGFARYNPTNGHWEWLTNR